MASRDLNDLSQYVHGAAVKHRQMVQELGTSMALDLLIYCTLRSNQEQDALYAQGRTVKGSIVTNARAGQSAHNPNKGGKAEAYDCCPTIGGKPIWDTKHPAWAIVGSCGEEAGLTWSGRWTGKLKETAHFQNPSWRKP